MLRIRRAAGAHTPPRPPAARLAWTALAGAVLAAPAVAPAVAPGAWPQFGGPGRDFKAPSRGLASSWPGGGPRLLWSRELGDGYSGIVTDGETLYTLYRPVKGMARRMWERVAGSSGDLELVVALEAATGRTLWEHSYDAPARPNMGMEYGPGPHATPLLVGDRLFAVGVTGKLHALESRTGRLLWSHDLWNELGGKVQGRGYSCSPIAVGDTVVLTVGGRRGQALMAFDQRTGAVAWKAHDFEPGPSSPLLVTVDGQEQLIVFHAGGVAGVDPRGGPLFWSHPHRTDYGLNISMPVWGEDNLLFLSSAYGSGSRVLRLSRTEGRTTATELWSSGRMKIHIGNALRLGDLVVGSSGDFGPAFVMAVDVRTGGTAWQERGFSRANFLYADGKLILLDEDGTLALATVSPGGLSVAARAQVLDSRAWTAPTLAGTRLYLRDRAEIKALDLSSSGP